jgi:hypothetical protein
LSLRLGYVDLFVARGNRITGSLKANVYNSALWSYYCGTESALQV